MGSILSYAGLQRNDFDSTLGGQVFRGVEPPRTGGGKCHLLTKLRTHTQPRSVL